MDGERKQAQGESTTSRFGDLTGQRFERLVVLERITNKGNHTRWRCRCDCGEETIVYGYALRRGTTRSCGCLQREELQKRTTIHHLTGQRFGQLTVISEIRSLPGVGRRWMCRCDCGKECEVETGLLTQGYTQSCGCRKRPNLTNERFGRLLVIARAATPDGKRGAFWRCVCDCGQECVLSTSVLQSDNTRSCGCLRREQSAARLRQRTTSQE